MEEAGPDTRDVSAAEHPQRRPELEYLFSASAARADAAGGGPGGEVEFVVFVVDSSGPLAAGISLDSEVGEIAQSAPGRRAAFLAGRACARACLVALGLDNRPIPRAADRSPVWPDGVTGSITHTEGFVAAVAARTDRVVAGIDAERVERTGRDVRSRILTRAESERAERAGNPGLATMSVFSAKEAFYKAQHQVTEAWVGFQDVTSEVTDEGLELIPATSLEALSSFHWPISANQMLVDGGPGGLTVMSAVAARPRPIGG
ncbi:MAG: 4'-phosphopantetheinyl transferase superfamily protein [Actinomycetia bacterium]|nr:4'-phosphopantetheinyl transferase superfamily protein [Actinomycetes bacterium]